MIGYVISLSIMVALANLPVDASFFGLNDVVVFSASGIQPSEPLPIITMHELPSSRGDSPSGRLDTRQLATAEVEAPPTERPESTALDPNPIRRAPVLSPVASVAVAGLPSVEETRKLLRFTGGPPAVDVPPRVRVGSMIVRYPISALKKAIEGLVIVRFTVEPSGRASGVEIVKGLDPACDEEVVEAIERARFLPGKSHGRYVPAYSQMTVRFVLANSGPNLAF